MCGPRWHRGCHGTRVRRLALAAATALASPLCGQAPRLVDCIEAPVAYLCLEAMPADGERAGPVQRLLTDPALDRLLAGGDAAEPTPSGRALLLVRGVLARSRGELELALTGVVPDGGQPLLVLRARLQPAEADRLQLALDQEQLAAPKRRIGRHATYALRGGSSDRPGREVELALVGADLVVGNDGTALQEVLAPPPARTAAGGNRGVLAGDPRFQAMKSQLPAAPGSLWWWGDWPRLRQRLDAPVEGVPGWLLGSSGLGAAHAVMASVAPQQADLQATMLLAFEGLRPPVPEAGAGRERFGPPRGPLGIDGWFAATEPVPARTLLADLPAGGLGGLVLSVDLATVAGQSHETGHLLRELHRAFEQYGLDFDRNVRNRLGTRGTVQLHVARGPDAAAEVSAVYTLRTRNRKAAADLLADLRRVAEAAGIGRMLPDAARERRGVEVLELALRDARTFVAAHDDSLLLAGDPATLAAVADDLRRAPRPRTRRGEPVAATIQAIGGETVAGLFDLDLQPWFEQLAAAFTGPGAPVDVSALPKRHTGYLDLQRHDDATVVRVRVLSSR